MTKRTKGSASHLLPHPHQDNLTQAQLDFLLRWVVSGVGDPFNYSLSPAAGEQSAFDELELRGYIHEQPAGQYQLTGYGWAMIQKGV